MAIVVTFPNDFFFILHCNFVAINLNVILNPFFKARRLKHQVLLTFLLKCLTLLALLVHSCLPPLQFEPSAISPCSCFCLYQAFLTCFIFHLTLRCFSKHSCIPFLSCPYITYDGSQRYLKF